MQVPPTNSFSISAVLQPAFASRLLSGVPPCPDPIIIASNVCILLFGFVSFLTCINLRLLLAICRAYINPVPFTNKRTALCTASALLTDQYRQKKGVFLGSK